MSNIPTSLSSKSTFAQIFTRIITFHLNDGDKVWDPTAGVGHSWEDYEHQRKHPGFGFCPIPKLCIISTDIKTGHNLLNATFNHEFDACFFDPPYIWGLKNTTDKRSNDYGEYHHDKSSLQTLIKNGFAVIHKALKKNGKLFFKYTDVFALDDRCFYFGAEVWDIPPKGFRIADHFIIGHRGRINPTAFQVKDRPCSVGNHTYITVMVKQ